jgi:hypothetical protein
MVSLIRLLEAVIVCVNCAGGRPTVDGAKAQTHAMGHSYLGPHCAS